MSLHILNPINPKVCPGAFTKFPPVPCYPFCWMRENMKAGQITDIDGFVINEKQGLVTALMQRREYNSKDGKLVLEKSQVMGSLFRLESEPEWKLRCVLSEKLKVPFYIALWPIDYPIIKASQISEPVIVYQIKRENNQINLQAEFKGDTNDLESFILKFRGRSFSSVKTFKVGMTMMECYLASKTQNPWPGNLDAAIWDDELNSFAAIIEFKTHNYPQYPISSQYFNQFPGDDRRYKAFDILQNHLAKVSNKPKFVYAIWGTDESHKEVKLQTIDSLKASHDSLIKRPEFTNATTKEFTEEVLRYIGA